MQYYGNLYGRAGQTRKYFDTGKTSADWDRMESENTRLRDALQKARDRFWLMPTVDPREQERLRIEGQNIADDALANKTHQP